MNLVTKGAVMFQINDSADMRTLDEILDAEHESDDVLDNCECLSLSGKGTEALHDTCPNYCTDEEDT
jgi:hypothetical protein